MSRTRSFFALALAFTLAVAVSACGGTTEPEPDPDPDPDPQPQMGSIEVGAATTGFSQDPDGYEVSVGTDDRAIAIDGSVTFADLEVGDHAVSIGGVAANCTVAEAIPQTVTVVADQTASVDFNVDCSYIPGDMTLLATDREGTIYTIDQSTGVGTRLFVPVTDDGTGAYRSIGVISSMLWVYPEETWWLGLGGQSACFGCVHTLDPSTGVSTFLSDPSATIRAVAGLAIDPASGRIYTTEADGSQDLYELDAATGALSTAIADTQEPTSAKGLTFGPDGLLYIGGSDELASIDVTGVGPATDLGSLTYTGYPGGVTRTDIRSMATRDDGVILAMTRDSRNDPGDLAILDGPNAELTFVGRTEATLDGLAYIPTELVELLAPPDASRIAFVSDRNGNLDVFVMDPHGGNLVQVTDDAADDDDPSINHERAQVAFASMRDGNWELYVKAADGEGPATRLTNTADGEWDAMFNSDASRIAFTREPAGQSTNTDIYSMAFDGTDVVQLTNNSAADSNPSWSPDGSLIAFNSQLHGGDWEIYTTDGTALDTPVRLTQSQGINADPDWSPDGARIAFKSDRTGQYEVWTMDPDGTDQVQLTTEGGEEPRWSADGARIVFTRGRDGARDGDFEVFVMNSDGSEVRPISNHEAEDEEVDWR